MKLVRGEGFTDDYGFYYIPFFLERDISYPEGVVILVGGTEISKEETIKLADLIEINS